MLTQHYIETVFESLEAALEHGIIDDWSVEGGNFVVHRGGERITVSQREAADYVTSVLRPHVESEEVGLRAADEKVGQVSPPPAHWLRLGIS